MSCVFLTTSFYTLHLYRIKIYPTLVCLGFEGKKKINKKTNCIQMIYKYSIDVRFTRKKKNISLYAFSLYIALLLHFHCCELKEPSFIVWNEVEIDRLFCCYLFLPCHFTIV